MFLPVFSSYFHNKITTYQLPLNSAFQLSCCCYVCV